MVMTAQQWDEAHTEALVVDEIKNKLAKQVGFTAWNITEAIREKVKVNGGWVQHFIVRDLVHFLYEAGKFTNYVLDYVVVPSSG